MKNEVIETRTAEIWLDQDGIIHYKVLPGVEVTIDDTREYVKIQCGLTKNKKVLNLTDLREVKSITHEAREYLSGEEVERITAACALLIGSPVSKVIGNFFLGINKPPYPIKIFTTEEKAAEWLKGFSEKEVS